MTPTDPITLLLDALQDAPDPVAHAGVIADWLEEQGRTEQARHVRWAILDRWIDNMIETDGMEPMVRAIQRHLAIPCLGCHGTNIAERRRRCLYCEGRGWVVRG